MTATDLDGNGTNNPSADRIRYSFRAITNANGNIVRETLTGAIGHRPRTKLGGLPLLPLWEEGGGEEGHLREERPSPAFPRSCVAGRDSTSKAFAICGPEPGRALLPQRPNFRRNERSDVSAPRTGLPGCDRRPGDQDIAAAMPYVRL